MNAAPSDSEGTPNSQDTSSVPQTPAVDTPLSATPASADPASQPSAPKKAKIVDDEDSQPVVSTKPAPEEEGPDDSVDDGREVCRYDGNCYRKNPQHFQEFRSVTLFIGASPYNIASLSHWHFFSILFIGWIFARVVF
jgi:hypothetical protein